MLAEGSVLVAHNLSVGYKSRFIKTDTIQGYQAANTAFRTNSKRSKWEIESSNGNNSHRGRNKTTTTTTLSSSSSSSSHPPQHQQQQQLRKKVNRITSQMYKGTICKLVLRGHTREQKENRRRLPSRRRKAAQGFTWFQTIKLHFSISI